MRAAKSCEASATRAPSGFVVAALTCGVFGLAAWVFDLWLFRSAPVQDWMVFYTAARAYFDGNLSMIFDGDALTAAVNHRFAEWLDFPLGLHPWVYPPPFLLLVLPFGILPPLFSVASFALAGFAASVFAVRRYLDSGIRRWPVLATLLLCPAVPFDVMTGQNALYTAALLIGSFGGVASPGLCGVLVGVLSVKPQLSLMAWVALIAARQWRALGAAVVSAAVLALASMLVVGSDIWRAWFAMIFGGNELYQAWINVGRLNGTSVYACVSWLGAPGALASLVQAAATVAAAAVTYWVYRHPASTAMRLATLLAATILAAPHVSNSDAVLLGLAASLFMTTLATSDLRPHQIAIAAAVWISPLFNPPVLFRIGCVTPLLVVMLLAVIVVTIRERKAAEGTPATAVA
jgi:alpha-1,2-mannosyltransferase